MLVLSRVPGEGMRIRATEPCDISVKVIERIGTKIKIGVAAPRSAQIMRDELIATVWGKVEMEKPEPQRT